MNINDVYEAEIRIVTRSDYFNKCYNSAFVKIAIVYRGKHNDYYDLSTKQRYVMGRELCTRGDMYINPESMVPISEIIDVKKDNMTKRKILDKYKWKY